MSDDIVAAAAPKPPTTATQARIEELARLSYEAPAPGRVYPPYERASWTTKEYHRKLARTLYAAAMRDAAGVAETALVSRYTNGRDIGTARRCIATALETIAKETDSAGN